MCNRDGAMHHQQSKPFQKVSMSFWIVALEDLTNVLKTTMLEKYLSVKIFSPYYLFFLLKEMQAMKQLCT